MRSLRFPPSRMLHSHDDSVIDTILTTTIHWLERRIQVLRTIRHDTNDVGTILVPKHRFRVDLDSPEICEPAAPRHNAIPTTLQIERETLQHSYNYSEKVLGSQIEYI